MTDRGEQQATEAMVQRLYATTDAAVWADEFCSLFSIFNGAGHAAGQNKAYAVGASTARTLAVRNASTAAGTPQYTVACNSTS